MKLLRILLLTLVAALTTLPSPLLGQVEDTSSTNVLEPAVKDNAERENPASSTFNEAPENAEMSDSPETMRRHPGGNELISFAKDVLLNTNETAEVIVVIGGSAKVYGDVRDAVVCIGGTADVAGQAETVVAVLGNIRLHGDARVSEAVAVLGGVRVSDNAQTDQAVSLGGGVDVSGNGVVRDGKFSLGLPGAAPEWVQDWFRQCLMKLRPLAPQVPWVWGVFGGVFVFYLLIAVILRAPVQACAEELLSRPASTLLVGLLSLMLLPVLLILLGATGLGVLVIPFLLVALFLMVVLGRVALLQAIGIGLGRTLRARFLQHPLMALLIGAIVIAVLYMVPVLGAVVFLLSGILALGAAVMAAGAKIRYERQAQSPPAVKQAWTAPSFAMAGGAGSVAIPQSPPLGSDETSNTSMTGIPPVSEVVTYPYAGFWERMGAAFLDVILLSILGSLVGGPPLGFLVALAYFAGMWAWRGTTIGGIVLGLKVVRLDGGSMSFAASLVRALAAMFSIIVLFLGFLWIAWDREKQGWHDKIAGTVVLKLPRGTPLV